MEKIFQQETVRKIFVTGKIYILSVRQKNFEAETAQMRIAMPKF